MTHLPNGGALKMDGAEAGYRCSAACPGREGQASRRAWGLCGSRAARLGGTASSADLGGSSKYSNENFED